MTKKAPFKSTVAALLLPWLLVQVVRAVDPLAVVVMPDGPVLCIKPEDNCQKACDRAQLPCGDTSVVGQDAFKTAAADPNNSPIFASATTDLQPEATKNPGMAAGPGPGEINSSSSQDGSSPTTRTPASEVQASSSHPSKSTSGESAKVGHIVGGVVGGVAFLALLGALLFFCLRRHPNKDAEGNYRSVDKSRASSPTSMSPVYGGAPPPPAVAPLACGSPPPAELPPAPAPLEPSAPAELL